MLILTDADGLGLDFDQLGQRILQTARNRDGRAFGDVKIGEFLSPELGGGVDAGACFADDRIANIAVDFR